MPGRRLRESMANQRRAFRGAGLGKTWRRGDIRGSCANRSMCPRQGWAPEKRLFEGARRKILTCHSSVGHDIPSFRFFATKIASKPQVPGRILRTPEMPYKSSPAHWLQCARSTRPLYRPRTSPLDNFFPLPVSDSNNIKTSPHSPNNVVCV